MDSDADLPRKKLKLSTEEPQANVSSQDGNILLDQPHPNSVEQTAPIMMEIPTDEASKEAAVGITQFLNPDNSGFSGLLKKRSILLGHFTIGLMLMFC